MIDKAKPVWAILHESTKPKEGDQCRPRGGPHGHGVGRWRKVTNFNGGYQIPSFIYRTPVPLK